MNREDAKKFLATKKAQKWLKEFLQNVTEMIMLIISNKEGNHAHT